MAAPKNKKTVLHEGTLKIHKVKSHLDRGLCCMGCKLETGDMRSGEWFVEIMGRPLPAEHDGLRPGIVCKLCAELLAETWDKICQPEDISP